MAGCVGKGLGAQRVVCLEAGALGLRVQHKAELGLRHDHVCVAIHWPSLNAKAAREYFEAQHPCGPQQCP